MEQVIGTFVNRNGEQLTLWRNRYQDGNLAVTITELDGCPYATLSVNFPELAGELAADEFFPKTWSENEDIAWDVFNSDLIAFDGKYIGDEVVWRIAGGR